MPNLSHRTAIRVRGSDACDGELPIRTIVVTVLHTSRLAVLSAALLAPFAHVVQGAAIYDKTFISTDVAPAARIRAGAVVETWGSQPAEIRPDLHIISQPPPFPLAFVRADDLIKRENIQIGRPGGITLLLGLPVSPVPDINVSSNDGSGIAFGPASANIPNDGHINPNSASATITVHTLVPGAGPEIRVRSLGNINYVPFDSVTTNISGQASAGQPVPLLDIGNHEVHTADSTAAVHIANKSNFVFRKGGPIPEFDELERRFLHGGSISTTGRPVVIGQDADPVVATLTDLNTGLTNTATLLDLTINYRDAIYSMDDSGIRFTTNRHDAASFVSMSSNNGSGGWVLNPYTYGATLNADGLSAFGLTPMSGWVVTSTADTVEAFFAFGSAGMPFDLAMVSPPDFLLTDGHAYQYEVDVNSTVYEIAALLEPTIVPEPGSIALFSIGFASLCVVRRRQRATIK